jgi:hypothetical protein
MNVGFVSEIYACSYVYVNSFLISVKGKFFLTSRSKKTGSRPARCGAPKSAWTLAEEISLLEKYRDNLQSMIDDVTRRSGRVVLIAAPYRFPDENK